MYVCEQLAILFNNFGLLTAYLIIIADILVGPGGAGTDGSGTGVLPMLFPDVDAFRSRAAVLVFVAVFGILPNALRKRMDGLKVQSMISMVLATGFIIITIALAVLKVRLLLSLSLSLSLCVCVCERERERVSRAFVRVCPLSIV